MATTIVTARIVAELDCGCDVEWRYSWRLVGQEGSYVCVWVGRMFGNG